MCKLDRSEINIVFGAASSECKCFNAKGSWVILKTDVKIPDDCEGLACGKNLCRSWEWYKYNDNGKDEVEGGVCLDFSEDVSIPTLLKSVV